MLGRSSTLIPPSRSLRFSSPVCLFHLSSARLMAMALEGHPCRTRGITVEGKLHGEDYSLIPKFEGPCFLKQPKSRNLSPRNQLNNKPHQIHRKGDEKGLFSLSCTTRSLPGSCSMYNKYKQYGDIWSVCMYFANLISSLIAAHKSVQIPMLHGS